MKLFAKKVLSRLAALFRKEKLDAEMEEEMRAHLEMCTQDNLEQGMRPEQARAMALRQFGWVESVKEACRDERGVSGLEHLVQDVHFAARVLRKNPGFTAVVVLTLALGIGANTAVFSVINTVLLRPLPYPHPERLVMLWERGGESGAERRLVSGPNFLDWKSQSRSFEQMAVSPGWEGSTEFNLLLGDGVRKVQGSYVSASFFNMFGVSPLLGRVFLPEEDRREGNRVAVLSWNLWQREFAGDPEVIGKPLRVDTYGRRDYTVVGVMPPGFGVPSVCELWLPLGWMGVTLTERRSAHWHHVLARLKPGVTVAQAEVELKTIQGRIQQEHPGDLIGSEVAVVPMLEQALGPKMKLALLVLWGVVAGVLLMACANVANLMLVRAATREREIAIRLALGATRSRIVGQLLVESVILALLGGICGMLLAYGSVQIFVALGSADIPRLAGVTIDRAALSFTVVLSLLTGVLFGLMPAWRFSRPDLNASLKEGGQAQSSSLRVSRIRDGLVVCEVALSVVLLISAALMLRSFSKLWQADRGVRPEHLVLADLDFSVSGFTTWIRPTGTRPQVPLQRVIENVRSYPGVQIAGAASGMPRRDRNPPNQTFAVFGEARSNGKDRPGAEQKGITPDFLRALGVPLLRGRWFTEADGLLSPGVALVNEAFVRRAFPDEDPIGKFITMQDGSASVEARDQFGIALWSQIVGIVGDVKTLTPDPMAVPEVYRPYWQWPMQNPTLAVRATAPPEEIAQAIRQEVKKTIPRLPVPLVRTMDQLLKAVLTQSRFQTYLLSLFAVIALLLAAIGLYGVLSYLVKQRTHEIGIRMALGAQKGDAIWLVVWQGMKLALAGVSVGVLAAWAFTRVMQSLLYEVRPTDTATFIGVVGLLLCVAFLATWIPARRAARVDPLIALRYE